MAFIIPYYTRVYIMRYGMTLINRTPLPKLRLLHFTWSQVLRGAVQDPRPRHPTGQSDARRGRPEHRFSMPFHAQVETELRILGSQEVLRSHLKP